MAGETAEQLRALTLAEDLPLLPGIHVGWLPTACNSSSRVAVRLWPLRLLHLYTYTQTHCIIKKGNKWQVLARMWGRRTLTQGGGNASWCSYYANQNGGSSKKQFKIELHHPATPLLGIYLKASKPVYPRDTSTSVFIEALWFLIAKLQFQCRCPNKRGMY